MTKKNNDEKNDGYSLRFLTAIKEKPEDIGKSKYMGYQLPCKGDSGNAHWMYDSKEKKRAVIAVTTFSNELVCGMDEHAMKTTYPSVLAWIKKYSGIKAWSLRTIINKDGFFGDTRRYLDSYNLHYSV